MLRLTRPVYERMVGHCLDGLPLEACGLLGGEPSTAKAKASGNKWRLETGVTSLYRNGKMAHTPFVQLCLKKLFASDLA